jgi:hypothetical protein
VLAPGCSTDSCGAIEGIGFKLSRRNGFRSSPWAVIRRCAMQSAGEKVRRARKCVDSAPEPGVASSTTPTRTVERFLQEDVMRRRECVLHYGSYLILADASNDAPENGRDDEWDTSVSVLDAQGEMSAPRPVPLPRRRFKDAEAAMSAAIRAAREYIDAHEPA